MCVCIVHCVHNLHTRQLETHKPALYTHQCKTTSCSLSVHFDVVCNTILGISPKVKWIAQNADFTPWQTGPLKHHLHWEAFSPFSEDTLKEDTSTVSGVYIRSKRCQTDGKCVTCRLTQMVNV